MTTWSEFEKRAYEAIRQAVEARDLGLDPEQCKVLLHPSYYSRDRGKHITVDVAVEIYGRSQTTPSIIWIWECKAYSHPVPVDDIEELHAKLEQIGSDRTKGTVITSSTLQSSALAYAISKGIGVACLLPDNRIKMGHPITAKSMFEAAEMITSAEQGVATEELCRLLSEDVERAACDPAFISWTRPFYGITPAGLVEPTGDLSQYIRMELTSLGAVPSVTIPCPIDKSPLLACSLRFVSASVRPSAHTQKRAALLPNGSQTLTDSRRFQESMSLLQQRVESSVAVVFDAAPLSMAGTGWAADYVLVGVRIQIPSIAKDIEREVYDEAVNVCRTAHTELGRSRSFYVLDFLREDPDSTYCTSVFMDHTGTTESSKDALYDTACLLQRLWSTSSAYRGMFHKLRFGFLSYSKRWARVLAIPLESPLDFCGRFPKHLDILTDEYKLKHLSLSGLFLGHVCFLAGLFHEAIREWLFALEHGETVDAYFNIACAYSKLGDMSNAFEYCKKAVDRDISPDLVLHDPDLAPFRQHALYRKILERMRRKGNGGEGTGPSG